jgi:hypothetical protein
MLTMAPPPPAITGITARHMSSTPLEVGGEGGAPDRQVHGGGVSVPTVVLGVSQRGAVHNRIDASEAGRHHLHAPGDARIVSDVDVDGHSRRAQGGRHALGGPRPQVRDGDRRPLGREGLGAGTADA